MSRTPVGEAVERALAGFESQPGVVQVAAGVLMGVGVSIASLGVFWLTLRILVDYFR